MKKFFNRSIVFATVIFSFAIVRVHATMPISEELEVKFRTEVNSTHKDDRQELLEKMTNYYKESDPISHTRFALYYLIQLLTQQISSDWDNNDDLVKDIALIEVKATYDQQDNYMYIQYSLENKGDTNSDLLEGNGMSLYCYLDGYDDYFIEEKVDGFSLAGILNQLYPDEDIELDSKTFKEGEIVGGTMELRAPTIENIFIKIHGYSETKAEVATKKLYTEGANINCVLDTEDSNSQNNSFDTEVTVNEVNNGDDLPDWVIDSIDATEVISPGEDIQLTFKIKNIGASMFDVDELFGEGYDSFNISPIRLDCSHDGKTDSGGYSWSTEIVSLLYSSSNYQDQDPGTFINLKPGESKTVQGEILAVYGDTETHRMQEPGIKNIECTIFFPYEATRKLEKTQENNNASVLVHVTQ